MNTAEKVKQTVFELADNASFELLTITERKKLYEKWTSDPMIGGELRQIMPPARVRVFLKDTIIGEYLRSRKPGVEDVLRAQGVRIDSIEETFIKPKALLCNRYELHTVCQASEWKIALINSFQRAAERAQIKSNTLYVTNHVKGHFVDVGFRHIVASAGTRLAVKVIWVH